MKKGGSHTENTHTHTQRKNRKGGAIGEDMQGGRGVRS